MAREDSTKQISVGGTTFLVRVIFRQNASWQGTVQWLEGKKTQHFRSLLELTLLLQEALEQTRGTAGAEEKIEFRSWNEKEIVS